MQCAAFSQVPLDGLYLLCDKLGKLFGKSPPPTHTHTYVSSVGLVKGHSVLCTIGTNVELKKKSYLYVYTCFTLTLIYFIEI